MSITNNTSYADFMGYTAYDDPPMHRFNEEHWSNGYHYDINDKKYKISEMTDQHLLNTIDYFNGSNTKPLIEEARRRNLLNKE